MAAGQPSQAGSCPATTGAYHSAVIQFELLLSATSKKVAGWSIRNSLSRFASAQVHDEQDALARANKNFLWLVRIDLDENLHSDAWNLMPGLVPFVANLMPLLHMTEYRVIDLQTEAIDPNPKIVTASSPEAAAELVLGLKLVRSGNKRDLRARVYSQRPGQPMSMVRLYQKVAHQQE